nr:MAG TPA: hypothetical protein [Caudoviricetes sp.]
MVRAHCRVASCVCLETRARSALSAGPDRTRCWLLTHSTTVCSPSRLWKT